jgi:magnesium transporter
MAKHIRKRRGSPVGAAPGSLISHPGAVAPLMHLFSYGPDQLEEIEKPDMAQIRQTRGKQPVEWLDVAGLGDVSLISALGTEFGLNPLALEDVVNVHQRPKMEVFPDHLFAVLRMLRPGNAPEGEQVSLFIGRDFLLAFQESPGDCFDSVRNRIRQSKGRVRSRGVDYLAYCLIDAIIDGYFPVLESYGEKLEALEDAVISRPEQAHASELHAIKRDLLLLRRAIWPMREMVNQLSRDSGDLVDEETRPFLRDLYDHAVQLMDMLETYREIASGLLDVYLSSMSAKLNEVMKVLTIIATIFMPLSFLVGLWGMNFDRASPFNMPELGWRYGYLGSLLLMAAVAAGLTLYFRRKGWLGRP